MIYAGTQTANISAKEIYFCWAHSQPTTWDQPFSTYLQSH